MIIHERLVQKALDAIERLFSDTSVSLETTRSSLEILVQDIEIRIEALECDIGG